MLVVAFGATVSSALARKGIQFSFGFLWSPAGVDLSEGVTLAFDRTRSLVEPFLSSDTNAQAFIAGLMNSLKVAVLAIALSTLLGTLIGVGRLSTNWIVRNLSFAVVEFLRNTPLLIQIVFWYFAVVLRLPPISAAANWYGGLIASRTGVFIPGLRHSETASHLSAGLGVAAIVFALASLWPRSNRGVRYVLMTCAATTFVAAFANGFPLELDLPRANRFGASGGLAFSPEFAAILLAIVVNSSAYIAEIVRGAIDALPRGQWEASAALGLSRRQTLRDIVLPQVFRVVLPSLGNRYISLTKDTSLGIAIGFPDLFNVYGTVANQTGRNLEGMVIVILTYLVLSWGISGLVNLANRRVSGATARV